MSAVPEGHPWLGRPCSGHHSHLTCLHSVSLVLQWASLCPKSTFRSSALLGVSKVPGAAGRCSPPPHLHARPRPLASVILGSILETVSSCDMDHDTFLGSPGPSSARDGIYEADPGFSQGQDPILLACPHPAYLLPFPMTVGVSAQPCSSSAVLFPLPAYTVSY